LAGQVNSQVKIQQFLASRRGTAQVVDSRNIQENVVSLSNLDQAKFNVLMGKQRAQGDISHNYNGMLAEKQGGVRAGSASQTKFAASTPLLSSAFGP